MIHRAILRILIVLLACSCAQQTSKKGQQREHSPFQNPKMKTGLKIETGPNLGLRANKSEGITNALIYTTSIITNDSIIPIHIQIALSKEMEFPSMCKDNMYKVFILPKELTPDTATLYNNIVSASDDFLKSPLDNAYVLNKTLNPGEYCVITIGAQYLGSSNCGVFANALFTQDNKELYLNCGSQINQEISTNPQLEIGVKLGYYYDHNFGHPPDSCDIIPCGKISYPEN